jgi:hypothetical protein
VLGDVTKVGDVRLDGQARTEIFRRGLQDTIITSFAGARREP